MSVVPNIEADLAESTLVLAADIVNLLKQREGFVVVETLLRKFLGRRTKADPSAFFDALTLLFSLGMIEYQGFRLRLAVP